MDSRVRGNDYSYLWSLQKNLTALLVNGDSVLRTERSDGAESGECGRVGLPDHPAPDKRRPGSRSHRGVPNERGGPGERASRAWPPPRAPCP